MPFGTTTTPLNFRATADQRGTIQKAAHACGVTVSDLIRAAALKAAARALHQGTHNT